MLSIKQLNQLLSYNLNMNIKQKELIHPNENKIYKNNIRELSLKQQEQLNNYNFMYK